MNLHHISGGDVDTKNIFYPPNGFLPKWRKESDSRQPKMFTREFHFMSYVVSKTLSLKMKDVCGKVAFTKISTNYIEDWEESVGSRYRSQAEFIPNPFGMVSYIKASVFKSEYKDGKLIIIPFVYQLENFPQDLWTVEEVRNYKFVQPKIYVDDLKKRLKDPRYVGKPFKGKQIFDLECLSCIYKELSPKYLNVLASHRDKQKSKWCFEFVCGFWSKKFEDVIKNLIKKEKRENVNDEKLVNDAEYCAKVCEQIEVKIDFIKNKVPKLINKLEDLNFEDKNTKVILDEILNHLKEKAPLHGLDKYNTYFAGLKKEYKKYREIVCPLTRELLRTVNNYHKVDYKMIPSTRKRAVMDIEYDEEEIEEDIMKIYDKYEQLKKREPLFRPIELEIPFDIGDGRGESYDKFR